MYAQPGANLGNQRTVCPDDKEPRDCVLEISAGLVQPNSGKNCPLGFHSQASACGPSLDLPQCHVNTSALVRFFGVQHLLPFVGLVCIPKISQNLVTVRLCDPPSTCLRSYLSHHPSNLGHRERNHGTVLELNIRLIKPSIKKILMVPFPRSVTRWSVRTCFSVQWSSMFLAEQSCIPVRYVQHQAINHLSSQQNIAYLISRVDYLDILEGQPQMKPDYYNPSMCRCHSSTSIRKFQGNKISPKKLNRCQKPTI